MGYTYHMSPKDSRRDSFVVRRVQQAAMVPSKKPRARANSTAAEVQ